MREREFLREARVPLEVPTFPHVHRMYYVRRVKNERMSYARGPCMQPLEWVRDKMQASLYPRHVCYMIMEDYRKHNGWTDDIAFRIGFDASEGGDIR